MEKLTGKGGLRETEGDRNILYFDRDEGYMEGGISLSKLTET